MRRSLPARAILARVLPAAALLALAAAPALAGKYNEALDIGEKAPAVGKLPTADGKTVSLADYKDAKAVVVVFTCNHCPVAKAYEQRFNALAKDYSDRGVKFLAISVSNAEEDTLAATKAYAKEKGLTFTYAHDESQKSGRAFGANVTPHAFVLGPDLTVRYMGAFDDSWDDADAVEKPYVRDAVEAVLAGKAVAVAESRQVGCGIEYDSK